MARNVSFTSPNHPIHNKAHITSIPNQDQRSNQCLSCLMDIIENINISKVQRQVILGLLNSALAEDKVVHLLASHSSDSYHLLCVLLEMYTDDLDRQTAASLCVSLIQRLQDETLYQIFMERFQSTVQSMPSGDSLKLCLTVMSQLCEISSMYSEMLIISNGHIILELLDVHNSLDEATLYVFIMLLTRLIQVINSSPLLQGEETEIMIWKLLKVLTVWINTLHTYNMMLSCLGLLKECLVSERLAAGLLHSSQEHNVLMGLKRTILTKDTSLITVGTQCLTLLLEKLKDPVHIRDFFNSDIAEFIFELLHSTCISQLESTLLCLLSMSRQPQFYEKCHAVYGIDSVLKATREALTMKKFGIVDKCLALLMCFLERQPETIPLFLHQSWNFCCQLLVDCLHRDSQEITLKALQTTVSFFRPQHVQSPVNIEHVSSILLNVQNIFQQCFTTASRKLLDINLLTSIGDLAIAVERILQCNTTLYGNEKESIMEVRTQIKLLCQEWIMYVITDISGMLRDKKRFATFMACLDILLLSIHDDPNTLVKIFVTGLPFQLIAMSTELQPPDDVQKLMCQNLNNLCARTIRLVKPALEINPDCLIAGLAKLKWQDSSSMLHCAHTLTSHDEIVSFFTLIFLSYFLGYQCWQNVELHQFLELIRQKPGAFTLDTVVARAYVLLSAISQTDHCLVDDTNESVVLRQLEKLPIEFWFTLDVRVFHWSLLTQTRTQVLGSRLVEYWILNLQLRATHPQSLVDQLDVTNKTILETLIDNQHFLFCLINLLAMNSVTTTVQTILLHCIKHLSLTCTGDKEIILIMESLFYQLLQKFNSVFIQQLTFEETILKSYLSVLCAMTTSPLCSSVDKTCCIKPLCHVLKLLTIDVNDLVVFSVQFISSVIVGLSVEDCKTVIPLLINNDNFVSTLESYVTETNPLVSEHALAITAWLAINGKDCQTHHPVILPSHCLLRLLASCQATSLPILQLVHAALCHMDDVPTDGAVRFVNVQRNFLSSRIFSVSELEQIYIYLQQFVGQKNVKLRSEAICCIQKLMCLGQDICQHVIQQPWNSIMLETMLSTGQDGLSESDIELVFKLSSYDQNPWTTFSADSFLLALLNSDLTTELQDKAKAILQQIKCLSIGVDSDLLNVTQECMANI
nr:meiosis inhibitor protein 1-like [Biomphalaria glabrata]